jgi:hypothetical protein
MRLPLAPEPERGGATREGTGPPDDALASGA